MHNFIVSINGNPAPTLVSYRYSFGCLLILFVVFYKNHILTVFATLLEEIKSKLFSANEM